MQEGEKRGYLQAEQIISVPNAETLAIDGCHRNGKLVLVNIGELRDIIGHFSIVDQSNFFKNAAATRTSKPNQQV